MNAGVVASMVQQFNSRSISPQLPNSPEISAPVAVCHTAGQKPGGAVLRSLLASSTSKLITASQSTHESGLLSSELSEVPAAAASSPQEKRFSGLGNTQHSVLHMDIIHCVIRSSRSSFRHTII